MFVISETNTGGYTARPTKTNNIRDIYDIVLNITDNEEDALLALEAAADMSFGSLYEDASYRLECVKS